jgi:hypothetical protein
VILRTARDSKPAKKENSIAEVPLASDQSALAETYDALAMATRQNRYDGSRIDQYTSFDLPGMVAVGILRPASLQPAPFGLCE